MDGGAWQVAVHGVARSRIPLSGFTFTFHFHALEKEMATHSSVFAWRIPGTGSLVGCRLWGRTESDMTEATQQQHQQSEEESKILISQYVCLSFKKCCKQSREGILIFEKGHDFNNSPSLGHDIKHIFFCLQYVLYLSIHEDGFFKFYNNKLFCFHRTLFIRRSKQIKKPHCFLKIVVV